MKGRKEIRSERGYLLACVRATCMEGRDKFGN